MRLKSILLFLLSYNITLLYGQAFDRPFISPLSVEDGVYGMALQPDGKVIIGGGFKTAGIISKKIVRLNTNGSIDSSFNVGAGFNGAVNEITLQADGKIFVGGFFTAFDNTPISNLVRLLPDGTLDNTFDIGSGVDGNGNSVQFIKVDGDGKIYIGGDITRFNGKPANMLIRLNSNGTLDDTFIPPSDYEGRVLTLALQTDGKILVGGTIKKVNSSVVEMIRLEANGSLDSTFIISSNTLNSINSIIILPNNKIIVGGDFQNYNNKPYPYIVRLEANGVVDESFDVGTGFSGFIPGGIGDPYPAYLVSNIALTTSGKIIVAGSFDKYNGTNVDGIIQLNEDGSINNTFQPCNSDGLNGYIYNVIVQPNDRILVGGEFGDFRGNPIATNVFRLMPNPDLGSSEPVASFDYVQLGYDVTFINNSTNANSFKWDFGDRSPSSLSNPLHTFSEETYYVSLTTSGLCYNYVTTEKILRILDIQTVYPNKGGNTGNVTIKISGAGFSPKAKAKLKNNNNQVIADTVFVSKEGRELICFFNLSQKEIGIYDVNVQDNNISKTLKSSFVIEKGSKPELFVNIIGRNVIRGGRKETYQISFGNNGNVDAVAAPMFISGIPKNAKWSLNARIDTLIDDSTIVPIQVLKKDSSQVLALIINRLPAQSSFSINLSIEVPVSETNMKFTAWINRSLIDQKEMESGRSLASSNLEECVEGFIDVTIDEISDVLIPSKCIQEGAKLFIETVKQFNGDEGTFDPTHPNFFTAYTKHVGKTGKAILICAGDLSVGRVKKFYEAFMEPLLDVHDLYEGLDAMQACFFSFIERISESILDVNVVSSFDPNQKVGITTNNVHNYTNGTSPLHYIIYFENKSTALAAAQEVIILDTIDKSKVNISSLQLQSFSFGKDCKISIPAGVQSYSRDTVLQRNSKSNLLVRVTAKIDTATGILRWRFLSLDPTTKEIINDPLDGFLPPNINAPEGEGYISYTVMPKDSLVHQAEIKNKAAIYFDYNDPINTNVFLNTIDKALPVSKVIPLPNETPDTTFTVKWTGEDLDAGMRSYDIYYSINNGPFQLWQYDVSADSSTFTGMPDSTYSFFSIAKDYAGNIENTKSSAEAIIHLSKDALPITSLPLQGSLNPNLTVSLSWSTLTEANNKGFEIERNAGNGWTKIGFVKGTGNSTREIKYSFIDSNVTVGKSYQYRYKQVDYDNHFSYSNIIIIEVKDNRKHITINTAPNPFTRNTLITYTLPISGNTILRLMDYTGKEVVKIVNQNQQAGVHKVDFSASSYGLSSGTYFLNLSNNHESITGKIVLIK